MFTRKRGAARTRRRLLSRRSTPNEPRLGVRLLVGLTAIALFTVASGLLVSQLLSRQEADGRIIEVARKQSGLALQAAADFAAAAAAEDEPARAAALQDLRATVDLMNTNDWGLRFGSDALGLPGDNSPEAQRLLETVRGTFAEFTRAAVLATSDLGSVDPDRFQEQAVLFSFGMDSLAGQYEQEAFARAETTRRTHLAFTAATLVLLLVVAFFVFLPAFNATRRSWQARIQKHAAERAKDREQLEILSQFDKLTGLPNRGLFMDRLGRAMTQARRAGGVVSIMTLNLDAFKTINEMYGFDAGDELLRQVATRIEASLRESDTVGRLGADQFGVVLAARHRAEHAGAVAEKLIATITAPYQIGKESLVVTAGVGIAVYPLDGDDVHDLVRDAETAMAEAKANGTNQYEYVTVRLRERSRQRLELLDGLRSALDRPDELRLVYQPKIDVGTGRILGVEALLRWDHPSLGLVMPGEFIPVAEQSDLIVPLGEWVLNRAVRQAIEWQREEAEDFSMAINVSSRQFRHGDLVAAIASALEATGLEPQNLEVELTEGTLIEDTELALRTIERLKEMGVRISIDDFGTGYSSLSYLKRFPIDSLKIDRSFVADINDDPDDAAISEAIVSLGRSLRLEVVAEGVETTEQLARLEELGCDAVQGFLFSKPLDPADLEQLLTSYRNQPSPFGVN